MLKDVLGKFGQNKKDKEEEKRSAVNPMLFRDEPKKSEPEKRSAVNPMLFRDDLKKSESNKSDPEREAMERAQRAEKERMQKKEKRNRWIKWGILAVLAILVLRFVVCCLIYKVPDVVGKNKEEAEALLNEHKMPYKIVETYTYNQEAGIVYKQSRKGGSSNPFQHEVQIEVSLGKKYRVPRIIGEQLSDCMSKLDGLPYEIRYEKSDTVSEGTIILLSKEEGTEMTDGDLLEVVVSGTEEQLAMNNENFTSEEKPSAAEAIEETIEETNALLNQENTTETTQTISEETVAETTQAVSEETVAETTQAASEETVAETTQAMPEETVTETTQAMPEDTAAPTVMAADFSKIQSYQNAQFSMTNLEEQLSAIRQNAENAGCRLQTVYQYPDMTEDCYRGTCIVLAQENRLEADGSGTVVLTIQTPAIRISNIYVSENPDHSVNQIMNFSNLGDKEIANVQFTMQYYGSDGMPLVENSNGKSIKTNVYSNRIASKQNIENAVLDHAFLNDAVEAIKPSMTVVTFTDGSTQKLIYPKVGAFWFFDGFKADGLYEVSDSIELGE